MTAAPADSEDNVPQSKWWRRLSVFERIIAIAASLIAILTTFNTFSIQEQGRKLNELLLDAAILRDEFEIKKPTNGMTIYEPTYDHLSGVFHGTIPRGRRIVVFLHDRTGYKLVNPAPLVDDKQHTWRQKNINFGADGSYDFVVCLTDEDGYRNIAPQRHLEYPDPKPDLPKGMRVLDSVTVNFANRGS